MTISLTVLLVVAGIVLLAFGVGSTGGAIRFLGGGAALLVAVAASAATIGLFWVGHKAHWTSDGPGMLLVMIAIVAFAFVAVGAWMIVFGVAATAGGRERVPDAPGGVKRVLRLVGVALIASAVVGQGVTAFLRRGRKAHAGPVVAVSFATQRARLVTVDAGGTLIRWSLRSQSEERRASVPELAGLTEFFVDSTGERGFAIAGGKAIRFEAFGGSPVETIPDARHIARSSAIVVAKERALLFVSYADWAKPPYREVEWPEPIVALAAKDMYVAVADSKSITLLDGRGNSARTIASVPTPGAVSGLEVLNDGSVIALDGNGGGWVIDVRRELTPPQPISASLVAEARHVFFVSGREVSEFDARKKTAAALATIGAGVRSIDTWAEHVALGFEDGEVVLGTRVGGKLETTRLTVKPGQP